MSATDPLDDWPPDAPTWESKRDGPIVIAAARGSAGDAQWDGGPVTLQPGDDGYDTAREWLLRLEAVYALPDEPWA